MKINYINMYKLCRTILCVVLLIFVFVCGCGSDIPSGEVSPTPAPTFSPTPAPASEYTHITFEDNFDGAALDTSKWELCPEWKRQDVGGFWDDSMVSLDGNGYLLLSAALDGGTYKSGAIRSKGLFQQRYGYFEIRCKVPQTTGLWSAFWLMCNEMNDSIGNGGTDGAEIDIMESASLASQEINHAVHWDGYEKKHRTSNSSYDATNTYDGDFHIFALEWTESEYIFYVDGNESWRTSAGGICKIPLYLKVTTEFGSWAGDIIDSDLPAQMIVDYVRVYSLEE